VNPQPDPTANPYTSPAPPPPDPAANPYPSDTLPRPKTMPQMPRAGQPMPGASTPVNPQWGQQVSPPRSGPQWGLPAPPEGKPNGHITPVSAPQSAQPQPQAAQPTKARGWWRRNWIGLMALVPLIALVVAVRWESTYWYAWQSQPRLAVNVAQQQWVKFSGAELRLAEFGAATNLVGSGNKPIVLPGGVTVWKAVLEFRAPDQEAVLGCEVSLEDSQKRLYGTGATELSNVRGQFIVTCTKPSEQPSSEYTTTALFLTPAGVNPVAVQVRWKLQFPRYVRLSVGG